MAKTERIYIVLEPDLKEHVVEYYKTQHVNLSESIRDFLKKETKFKRKNKSEGGNDTAFFKDIKDIPN